MCRCSWLPSRLNWLWVQAFPVYRAPFSKLSRWNVRESQIGQGWAGHVSTHGKLKHYMCVPLPHSSFACMGPWAIESGHAWRLGQFSSGPGILTRTCLDQGNLLISAGHVWTCHEFNPDMPGPVVNWRGTYLESGHESRGTRIKAAGKNPINSHMFRSNSSPIHPVKVTAWTPSWQTLTPKPWTLNP